MARNSNLLDQLALNVCEMERRFSDLSDLTSRVSRLERFLDDAFMGNMQTMIRREVMLCMKTATSAMASMTLAEPDLLDTTSRALATPEQFLPEPDTEQSPVAVRNLQVILSGDVPSLPDLTAVGGYPEYFNLAKGEAIHEGDAMLHNGHPVLHKGDVERDEATSATKGNEVLDEGDGVPDEDDGGLHKDDNGRDEATAASKDNEVHHEGDGMLHEGDAKRNEVTAATNCKEVLHEGDFESDTETSTDFSVSDFLNSDYADRIFNSFGARCGAAIEAGIEASVDASFQRFENRSYTGASGDH